MFGKKEETREEITKRLKEAAEKGVSPKDVVGFKEIEENRNDSIKKHPCYVYVKAICMELAKSGYELSLVNLEFDKRTYNSAAFYVYANDGSNIGSIMLYTDLKQYYGAQKREDSLKKHLENRDKAENLFHQIHVFPCLYIQSRVTLPQDPPEWLIICADILKRFHLSPDDIVPEWVKEYPDAKKYINAMFW